MSPASVATESRGTETMFDSVNALSRRLPHPVLTGDPRKDRQLRGQIMDNARVLRSEAVACIGRALSASPYRVWRWLTRYMAAPASHQT